MRYQRNNFTSDKQKALKNSKVLIAGLGGLGSGVLASLAGLGVGTLFLLDSDVVEESNLNRQFIHRTKDIGEKKTLSARRFLEEFNPEISAVTLDMRLQEDSFPDILCDVIVDCFDNVPSKLALDDFAQKLSIPLVHGGIDGYFGQIMTIVPKKTPSLRDIIAVCEEIDETKPTSLAPVVNTVSSLQALFAMKILLNEPFEAGKLIKINLKNSPTVF